MILEGLPVEMTEDDVGHHHPFHQSLALPLSPYHNLPKFSVNLQSVLAKA